MGRHRLLAPAAAAITMALTALLGSGCGAIDAADAGGDDVGGDPDVAAEGDAATMGGDDATEPAGDTFSGGDTLPGGDAAPKSRDEILADLHADDPVPNPGWIGGACTDASACVYPDSLCLTSADGYPDGACSQSCDLYCPDRTEAADTTTFCIDDGSDPQGSCVSRCDFNLLVDGCRPGYACEAAYRHSDPTTVRSVCVPADADYVPPSSCYADRIEEGLGVSSWNAQADLAAGDVCWVQDPMRLETPVLGVAFRYVSDAEPAPLAVNCRFAEALGKLAQILAAHDIVEVVHIGTYNCRVIDGTSTLSEHSFGNAIDLHEFVRSDGKRFNVEQHWEPDTDAPVTEEGRFLYDLVHELYDQYVFNVILTPNYNAAHYNHFHVDLTEGSHFLYGSPYRFHYLGPNVGH